MGRPLEQEAASEGAGRLADRGADQPVEVEAGQVRPPGQVVAGELRLVEAVLDEVEDPAQSVGGCGGTCVDGLWVTSTIVPAAAVSGLIVLAVPCGAGYGL